METPALLSRTCKCNSQSTWRRGRTYAFTPDRIDFVKASRIQEHRRSEVRNENPDRCRERETIQVESRFLLNV